MKLNDFGWTAVSGNVDELSGLSSNKTSPTDEPLLSMCYQGERLNFDVKLKYPARKAGEVSFRIGSDGNFSIPSRIKLLGLRVFNHFEQKLFRALR